MKCRICGQEIESSSKRCPKCGATVPASVKKANKPLTAILRILKGIGIWFASVLLIAFIGGELKLADKGETISAIFSLTTVILPIVLAVKLTAPKKPKTTQEEKSSSFPKSEIIHTPQTPADKKEAVEEKTIPIPPAPAPASDSRYTNKTYRLTGTTHYVDNIMSLAVNNPDYEKTKKELIKDKAIDERIWQYVFYPSNVELIPEPDNPHDPNAIKVVVDGAHVGYIKSGSCAHLHKMIKSNGILGISCTITGGPYKYIYEDYGPDEDEYVYVLEKDKADFFASLSVRELRDK